MAIAAGSYSQNTRFDLNVRNASIVEVLEAIENKTEYGFLFKADQLDLEARYNLELKDAKIENVMNEILNKDHFSYKIMDRIIVISKNGTEALQGGNQPLVKISGKVTDTAGQPLPGVSVVVKGTTNGTVTNIDGDFSFSGIPAAATLQFSFVGMKSLEVNISGKTTLNVKMEEETVGIEEVVAIAYGTARKKDLTGSLSTVDGKLMATQSASSVTRALEGVVAGLQVSSVDGQPGTDMAIRVRGVGSANLNSSGALIVIDGVPAQIDNPLSTINSSDIANVTVLKDAASTALYGSRGANGVVLITTKKGETGKTNISFSSRWGVNSVGPFDIGTIDNAADYYKFAWQSIYNSYRYGVNGTGQPQNWTTNVKNPNYSHEQAAEFASQHLFNYVNSETKFGRNRLGNYMAYSVPGAVYTPDGTGSNASATMSGAYLIDANGQLNPNAKLLYDDNYSNVLLDSRLRQEYNISANGGTDKMNYFLSLGYLQDPSYISNSKFDRYSGRTNVNARLYDWFKAGANVAFARTSTNLMATSWGRNPGSNQGNVFRFINGMAPIVPVYAYNEDGSYRTHVTDGTNYNSTAGSTYSPFGETGANYGSTNIVYSMENDVRNEVSDVWNTRTYAELSFLKDFKFLVNFSFDKNNWLQTRYMNSVTGLGKKIGGMFKSMHNLTIINSQEMLTYDKDIKKHHVDAMVAHEFNNWEREQLQWGAGYELIPGFLSSSNFVGRYANAHGSMGSPGYGHDIVRMESYLGRLNYVFDEKYYFSGSVRRDGSSKFKKDRWGNFWSLGGGWRVSSESFMEITRHWLDNLKLRASYGVIGNANAIGNYSGYRTWSYGAKYTSTESGTGIPKEYTMGVGGFVNDALTWENTNTFDIGIDFSLFNRFSGSFDFYNRVTDNTFYNQPVNYMAVGQETLQSNSAVIRNQGIEVELMGDIIRAKDFSWNVSLNGTHYTTILTKVPEGSIPQHTEGLPEYTYEANGEGWTASGAGNAASGQYYLRGVGRDWYNLWIYKYAGVDQETGLPLYYRQVTAEDVQAGTYPGAKVGDDVKVKNYNQASKYEIGSAIPKWIGGVTTTFKYKDFDFSAILAYQLGGKFYSVEYGNGLYRSSYYLQYNLGAPSKDLIGNTWTPENKNAKYPMQWYGADYYDGATFGSWKYTDLALFSASYMRVKNVTFGYTFPKQTLSKINVSKLRVYASADNLFMFSAARGIDPSMSLTGGMEVGAYTYPTMRTVSLGINLEF